MGGILVAGLIVMYSQNFLHFSGLENAVSADIIEAIRKPPFDFRQVLMAGMLMGVLGVAVDGAIEVSSSMEEIRRANPNMPTWRLITSGMNVGTDILGTNGEHIGVRLSRRGVIVCLGRHSTKLRPISIPCRRTFEHWNRLG